MRNNDDILKTIETSDLDLGGALDPERQDQFARLIRDQAKMLAMVRFETLPQLNGSIDRLHIGEPITSDAQENTASVRGDVSPKLDRIPITATKLRSDWSITRETLMQNIEKQGFENTIMETMSERMRTDFEMLAIQGDPATFAAVNTPVGYLLRNNQGWDVQTDDVHMVDAAGAEIAREMFSASYRAMPAALQAQPGLRWFINPNTLIDYVDLYGARATGGGDDANASGTIDSLLGMPITTVPLIPSNKVLSVTAATSAAVLGNELDPFIITAGVDDAMLLDIDNAGGVPITLTAGLRNAAQVAAEINTAIGATVAYDNGYGALLLQSTTTGVASEIDIQNVAANAYTILGLTVAVTIGSAAGAAGNVPEGTFVWLANPENFVWVMVLKTAIFSEFEKDFDRMEFTTYSYHDFVIENEDAIVKLENVRRRNLL